MSISDENAMTLFWWWSIDTVNGCKGKAWRDTLTPEEQALVEKWDAMHAAEQKKIANKRNQECSMKG